VQEKITLLSAFESQMDEVVDHSFEGDDQFADGLKDGIEYFINLRENNAIKLLAKHTDQVLRNPVFDEELLDKGMFLFRYMQSKDAFEVIYKRDLAKRLLLNVTNKNAEKIMLTKMKKECGAGYTGKLEGMVKDIEKSVELMTEFNVSNWTLMNRKKKKKASSLFYQASQMGNSSLDINVNLLTYGFWPTYIPINANLPPMFLEAQNAYRDFYMTKFEKRVLTWQNPLGVCEVTANYPHVRLFLTIYKILSNQVYDRAPNKSH
jgi:cullin-4